MSDHALPVMLTLLVMLTAAAETTSTQLGPDGFPFELPPFAAELRAQGEAGGVQAGVQGLPHTLTKINHACGKSGLQKFDLPQVRLTMVS